MLSKSYRLPGVLIPIIAKEGKIVQNPLFVLKFLDFDKLTLSLPILKNSQNSLFAFVFPKKISKKAVRRNQARRRLIQSIQTLLPTLPKNLAIVFFARQQIFNKTYQEIFTQTQKTIEKIKSLFPLRN